MNNGLNNSFFNGNNRFDGFDKQNKINKHLNKVDHFWNKHIYSFFQKYLYNNLALIFGACLIILNLFLLINIIIHFNELPAFYIKFTGFSVLTITNIQLEIILMFITIPLILLSFNLAFKKTFKLLFWIINVASNCLILLISITWWFISYNHQLENIIYNMQHNVDGYPRYWKLIGGYYIWPILSLMLIFSMIVYFLFKSFQLKNNQYINKPVQVINTICEFILFCGMALITFNSARWYIYLICITLSLIGFYKQVIEPNQLHPEKSAKKKQA